ncbi:hypothetical protein GCM10028864_26910 [Microlunatus parietis]
MVMTESGRERIRVGHSERDAAAEALRDAAADGRITLEELDERLERALSAKTFADLDVLFVDLGGPAREAAPVAEAPLPQLPGFAEDDPLILDGGFSSVTRTGAWELPPFIRINAGAGTVRLNCLQATTRARVIDIEVIASMGTVVIVVPDGWAANTDRLSTSWGTAKSKITSTPTAGKPVLVLRGSLGMGTLRVRHPSRGDLRRLEKALQASRRRALER